MDNDLMDGLSQEQFERVCDAERKVADAHKALDDAMRNLADVQIQVWQETKSNA